MSEEHGFDTELYQDHYDKAMESEDELHALYDKYDKELSDECRRRSVFHKE